MCRHGKARALGYGHMESNCSFVMFGVSLSVGGW